MLADDVERGDESRRTDSKGKNEFHALPPPAVVARFRLRRPEVGPEFGARDAEQALISENRFQAEFPLTVAMLDNRRERNSFSGRIAHRKATPFKCKF